jgi:hypothetical protein
MEQGLVYKNISLLGHGAESGFRIVGNLNFSHNEQIKGTIHPHDRFGSLQWQGSSPGGRALKARGIRVGVDQDGACLAAVHRLAKPADLLGRRHRLCQRGLHATQVLPIKRGPPVFQYDAPPFFVNTTDHVWPPSDDR